MARNKQNANIRVHFRTGILLRLTKIWSAKRKCNRHVYVWSPNSQRTNRTELLHYARISQHTHEFRAPGRALPTMQNFIYTNVGQALACVSSSLFLSNYTIQSKKKKGRNTGHVLSQECPSPALLTPYREFLRCPGLNQSIHTRFWWE